MAGIPARGIVDHFSPAWFAMIMGTGGLANVLHVLGQTSDTARFSAALFFGLNLALFLALLIPWTLRWIISRENAVADLKNPMLSNFYATMPAGCIILGTNILLIGRSWLGVSRSLELAGLLWVIGIILVFYFAIAGMLNLFSADAVGPESMTFAWLMTPVVNIVVPLLGNSIVPLVAVRNPALAGIIHTVDMIFFGIGFFLFILMSGIILNRLILHKMPPGAMAPSFWILLAPVGVGTVVIIGLADAARTLGLLNSAEPFQWMASALWGFGFWAFTMALAVTIKYQKNGGIPFTLSWWAFTFPMAAYTLATFAVYGYTHINAVKIYGLFLAVLLIMFWLSIFIRTLRGVLNGALLMPNPGSPK